MESICLQCCLHFLLSATLQETSLQLAPLTLDCLAAGLHPAHLQDLRFPDMGRFLHKLRVQECSPSSRGNTSKYEQGKEVQSISLRTSNARGPMVGSRGSAQEVELRWFSGVCWRDENHSHIDGPSFERKTLRFTCTTFLKDTVLEKLNKCKELVHCVKMFYCVWTGLGIPRAKRCEKM